jgi:hypothetical protein
MTAPRFAYRRRTLKDFEAHRRDHELRLAFEGDGIRRVCQLLRQRGHQFDREHAQLYERLQRKAAARAVRPLTLEQKTEKMENYIFRTVDGQAQSIRRHTGEGLKRNTLPRLLDKCIAQLSDWGELQIRGISQQAGRQIRVAGRISTVPVDAASIENLPIDRDKILRRLGRAECDRRYRARTRRPRSNRKTQVRR